MPSNWIRPALETGLYILFFLLTVYLLGWLFLFAGNALAGSIAAVLLGAVVANQLCFRIFAGVNISEAGLPLAPGVWRNLTLGLVGGALVAALVSLLPAAFGLAHFVPAAQANMNARTVVFVMFTLGIGAIGEELLFRGYAFQMLIGALGPFRAILPVGVLFGVMHGANPNSSALGLVNTAGFGIAFGYAFLRTHDIWLPLGLHFGWNLALMLLGLNISGLTMRVTGYELVWNVSPLWSGGAYGPEASPLTSAALPLLFWYIGSVRVARQANYLLDRVAPREERAV